MEGQASGINCEQSPELTACATHHKVYFTHNPLFSAATNNVKACSCFSELEIFWENVIGVKGYKHVQSETWVPDSPRLASALESWILLSATKLNMSNPCVYLS